MNTLIDDFLLFGRQLEPSRALLGLDLGTKTIGIAVSDTERVVASPLSTIERKKFREDACRILEIANGRQACGFVVGLPRNMNGTEGPRCQASRTFAREFASLTRLPVGFWDERLSSKAAERSLLEAGASRKRRREVIDHVAASIILQNALDFLVGRGSQR